MYKRSELLGVIAECVGVLFKKMNLERKEHRYENLDNIRIERNNIMKRTKKIFISFVIICSMVIASMSYSVSAASTVQMNLWGYGSSTANDAKKLAKKIGNMRSSSSKEFKTAYYKGNNVVIGINGDAQPGTRYDDYIYVKNTGNKKFTICGVKIGDSKSSVKNKMSNQYNMFTVRSGKTYRRGEAGYIKFYYKNGKVSKWIYTLSPTG